jgi:DNA-directed RNA polymerase specialized sigma24 family protein
VVADPADQVVTRDVLLTALGDLSPRQRACVVLRYYQDLPVAMRPGGSRRSLRQRTSSA